MSNEALNWAFNLKMKPGPKFVLVALSDYADEEHGCYPSYNKLSKKTGIKKKTIANHIALLTKYGLIEKERQRYDDGNLGGYRFTLHLDVTNDDFEGTDLQTVKANPRGKPFKKCDKNAPHLKLAPGQPVLKSGDIRRKIGGNQSLNLHDNIPQYNHQQEPSGKNTLAQEQYTRLVDFLKSKIPKTKLIPSGDLRDFGREAVKVGPEKLTNALIAFYSDSSICEQKGKYAPKLGTALSERRYEPFLTDLAEQDEYDRKHGNNAQWHRNQAASLEKQILAKAENDARMAQIEAERASA